MSKSKFESMSEPIVISGMSGRFPESDTTDELRDNFYNNFDMITEDDRRWPTNIKCFNHRMGKLKHLDKCDTHFFRTLRTYAQFVDPQSRILIENTYEAIIDAGINPQTLENSKTGVYIGCTTIGYPDGVGQTPQPDAVNVFGDEGMKIHSTAKCLFANRISYIFDFKGPSLVIDSACTSGSVALNTAFNDIRLGKCDQAIVGASAVILQAYTNYAYQWSGVCAMDGISKVWDENANGYVRGEAVVSLFLQRKSSAKRIYATVLNTGVNSDGYKTNGYTFPSSELQTRLMVDVCNEVNINPAQINYFEAHGTGTAVGDTIEAKAIYDAYCLNIERQFPIFIGLAKSYVGHSEAASGLMSIMKAMISFENECIAANLNLNTIKSTIEPFISEKTLIPVLQNTAYIPGIAGINNFAIGGTNANFLLEPNYKTSDENSLNIADSIPRIINICCRTEEAFNQLCDWIENNPQKVSREFLALLADTMRVNPCIYSCGLPYRGWVLIKQLSDKSYDYKRQYSVFESKSCRPLCFVFPGLGGQWVGMAKALMPIKIFADVIEECHQVLEPFKIDLKHLLLSDDKNSMSKMIPKFCATTALQLGFIELLRALNIKPDRIIGHSFGEVAAAFADGCLSIREAILTTCFRGFITESPDKKTPNGLMAAVALSWDETINICPEGVEVVCNNGRNSVVISGLEKETKLFMNTLRKRGVFVKELENSNVPYHSSFMKSFQQIFTQKLKGIITNPKPRTKRWVSTCVNDMVLPEELKCASAEYFVHNLISPVYFYNKLQEIPSDAIVVEIGPHGVFSSIVKECLTSGEYITLMKRDSNDTNLEMFFTSIGRLYELGVNPIIENLYPCVEWPVPRGTQSISSLMRWDHSKCHNVAMYPDHYFRPTESDLNWTIDLKQNISSYLSDNSIDGRIIYPATGYLMLAWRQLAAHHFSHWNTVPVIFEDVHFRMALILAKNKVTKIKVKYFNKTDNQGDFEISEGGNILCVGKIRTDEDCLQVQHLITDTIEKSDNTFEFELKTNDIYKELRVRGYDYGHHFKKLLSLKTNDFNQLNGCVEWEGNWVTFVYSLLQSKLIANRFPNPLIPVMIKHLRCDPIILNKAIDSNRILENTSNPVFDSSSKDMELTEKLKNEFKQFKAILPFYVNLETSLIVSNGIEIGEVIYETTSHPNNDINLKLESYEFISNEDFNAIDETQRNTILDYIQECSILSKELEFIFKNENNQANLINKTVINKYNKNEQGQFELFKILEEIIEKNLSNNNIIEKRSEYEKRLNNDILNKMFKNEHLIRPFVDIVFENNVPKKEIRVLELSLNNDIMAEEIYKYLSTFSFYPIDVNYTIAVQSIKDLTIEKRDVFRIMEMNFNNMYNISKGIKNDLIIDKSFHTFTDFMAKLQTMFNVLEENGFLLSIFKYKMTEPEEYFNQIIGENIDLSKIIEEYIKTAEKIGLILIGRREDTIGWLSLLFRKVDKKIIFPKEKNVLKISSEPKDWFNNLKEKISEIRDQNEQANIWLIGEVPLSGVLGLINCLRHEPGGETLRCVFSLDKSLKLPINWSEKQFSNILKNDLTVNVIKNENIGTFRYLSLTKNFNKIQSNKYLVKGKNNGFSGLQWYDLSQMVVTNSPYNQLNQRVNRIDCEVYMCGLNFKDIEVSKGHLSVDPSFQLLDSNLGIEFCGRNLKTGERVMGMAIDGCFRSHINADENMITKIPDHWSMEEAVTIPVIYFTVWYELIKCAQIREGDTILVHSGTESIGEAAINVCQYYKCHIFVSVGDNQKKEFLIKKYNIPENRIFSSKDIKFKYKIKELTKGKGVDIVLNSLKGHLFDASIDCLSKGGRFVEIGKYELQMNKQLGMDSLLKGISIFGIELDVQMTERKDNIKEFYDWLQRNSNNGVIKTINTKFFDCEDIQNAFKYMSNDEHIGKVVIKLREEENKEFNENIVNNKVFNISKQMIVSTKTYFNPNKVYIITGGLGGMGLELVQWMLYLGARKFVLTSRYGVKTDYQKFVLNRFKSFGEKFKYFESNIIVSTKDTKTIEGSNKLITDSQKLGQIGGVFHLALVINDKLLEDHILETYVETVDTKVKTCLNLDKMSRDLDLNLDYFVVFSSIICGKGNGGQSNYGYGNSVCERICESRRRDGLHGLAVQWGPVGDVGIGGEYNVISTLTVVKQRINSCFETLDKLLQTNKSVVSCLLPNDIISECHSSETPELSFSNTLWHSLGVDPNTIPNDITFGELGMSSLFLIDFQHSMQKEFDITLKQSMIKKITIGMLKQFEQGQIHIFKQLTEI